MGYRELLQALEEEVGRQARELRAQAAAERERLLEATRAELLASRQQALAAERERLVGVAALSLSKERLEQERAVLVEMRAEMDEARRQAEARLPTLDDPALVARLMDELAPELAEGALEVRVAPGREVALGDHLARMHPALFRRATLSGSPAVGGGLEVVVAGRQVLDNTLASRLASAWQGLEAEVAARLFGEGP